MKNVFITGSTRGIGKQIGIDLLKRDCLVYFNGHSRESIVELDNELNSATNANIISLDLSTIENMNFVSSVFIERNISLDYLVLNLGVTNRTPFGEIIEEDWNKVFETNLSAPFFLIQALRNNINENGRIIFISSLSGIVTDSVSISYGVSKAAINMLVPYLAKEFANKKITVNAVAPGYIDNSWHKGKSIEQIKRIEQKCLAKRLGTVEEVSKVVLSIIDNDYINGQIIQINGGFGLCSQ